MKGLPLSTYYRNLDTLLLVTVLSHNQNLSTMTINDLKLDIIAAVSQLTNVSLLKELKSNIDSYDTVADEATVWKDADVELRSGVSFEQIMQEQNYQKNSLVTFSHQNKLIERS